MRPLHFKKPRGMKEEMDEIQTDIRPKAFAELGRYSGPHPYNCGLHEIFAQNRGHNSSVIPTLGLGQGTAQAPPGWTHVRLIVPGNVSAPRS
jgi:hypothetical protein